MKENNHSEITNVGFFFLLLNILNYNLKISFIFSSCVCFQLFLLFHITFLRSLKWKNVCFILLYFTILLIFLDFKLSFFLVFFICYFKVTYHKRTFTSNPYKNVLLQLWLCLTSFPRHTYWPRGCGWIFEFSNRRD